MKIRTDFVSNSSSSSFVLFGIEYDSQTLLDSILQSNSEKVKKELADNASILAEYKEEEASAACVLDEILGGIIGYSNYVADSEEGIVIIGKSPSEMKDNETLLEFKQKIVDMLKPLDAKADVSKVSFVSGTNNDGYISFD